MRARDVSPERVHVERKPPYSGCRKKYLVEQLRERDARLVEQEEQLRTLRENVALYKSGQDDPGEY